MRLRELCVEQKHRSNRRDAKCRERRERGWTCALRIGAGRIGVGVSRMMRATLVVVCGARSSGVAQHDFEAPLDRREHKAGRNDRAKAQNGENKRRGPVTRATVLPRTRSCFHMHLKMPQHGYRIK
jgi:hypothetical protein